MENPACTFEKLKELTSHKLSMEWAQYIFNSGWEASYYMHERVLGKVLSMRPRKVTFFPSEKIEKENYLLRRLHLISYLAKQEMYRSIGMNSLHMAVMYDYWTQMGEKDSSSIVDKIIDKDPESLKGKMLLGENWPFIVPVALAIKRAPFIVRHLLRAEQNKFGKISGDTRMSFNNWDENRPRFEDSGMTWDDWNDHGPTYISPLDDFIVGDNFGSKL